LVKITVVREIPAYAGFYSAYEFSKRKFQKSYGHEIPVWAVLTSGAMGGLAYWTACYPLGGILFDSYVEEPLTDGDRQTL
jgi:hypothetical protein